MYYADFICSLTHRVASCSVLGERRGTESDRKDFWCVDAIAILGMINRAIRTEGFFNAALIIQHEPWILMPLKFKRGCNQPSNCCPSHSSSPPIHQPNAASACGNDFIGAAGEHGTLVTLVIFGCSNDVARVAD